jgi:hypothetical protein
MKALFAAALLTLFTAAVSSAQFARAGALGGAYASQGMARPLGGIGSSFRFGQNQNFRGRSGSRSGVYALPYTYSVYVPSYFDALGDQGYYPPVAVPPPPAAAGNPPVIINQFFGAQDSGQGFAPGGAPGGVQGFGPVDPNGNPIYPSAGPQPPPAAGVNAPQAGDPLGPAQNYYLIAYKDHSVYAVLAYWLEGNTLNYVTVQNTHNQASLNLIDLDLTKTLNQARSIPFSLPGK